MTNNSAHNGEGKKPNNKKTHNKELGLKGEEAAVRFLERRGFEILERNWTCSAGEADIIAREDEWLVFVEVKTRTNPNKGFPSEAVTPAKRDRYERIAAQYLAQTDFVDIPIRFDIVAILLMGPDRAIVRHHSNAFL